MSRISSRGLGAPGAVLALLAAVLGGCGDAYPTAPGQDDAPGVAPHSAVATGFPEPSGPARVYSLVSEDTRGWTGSRMDSRYVLYDNGAFALQFSGTSSQTNGRYVDTDGLLELAWEQNSTVPEDHPDPARWPGPWEATATLAGDTLSVAYPVHMWLVGFLDAVYVLTP